jgi:hypothetical protein
LGIERLPRFIRPQRYRGSAPKTPAKGFALCKPRGLFGDSEGTYVLGNMPRMKIFRDGKH